MTKLKNRMALERERERERGALLNNKFFARRILLSMLQISKKIDKVITGIDCIIVNVFKRNIYGDMAYPFLCVKKIKREYKTR